MKAFSIIISLLLGSYIYGTAQTLEQTFLLAEQQLAQNEYANAALLYRRVLLFDTANVYSQRACMGLAEGLAATNNYPAAIDYLSWAYRFAQSGQVKRQIGIRKAELYLLSEKPDFALIELIELPNDSLSERDKYKKNVLLGITSFLKEDFNAAETHFLLSVTEKPEAEQLIRKSIKLCKRADKRFPVYVKYFSLVIPGSAQFVYGSREQGINSLVLVAAFGGMYYYTLQSYGFIDAWLGVFPWYLRYYQGGFENAEKARLAQRKRYINKHYRLIITAVGN